MLLQNAELKQRVFDLSREQMSLREKIGILEASLVEQMASSTARANELKNQCDRTIGDLTTHHKERIKKLEAEREQCQRKQADAERLARENAEYGRLVEPCCLLWHRIRTDYEWWYFL